MEKKKHSISGRRNRVAKANANERSGDEGGANSK